MSLSRLVWAIDTDPHESNLATATLIEYLSLSITDHYPSIAYLVVLV